MAMCWCAFPSQVSGYSERTTWVRNPQRTTRVTADQIKESVDASLKRLQVGGCGSAVELHGHSGGGGGGSSSTNCGSSACVPLFRLHALHAQRVIRSMMHARWHPDCPVAPSLAQVDHVDLLQIHWWVGATGAGCGHRISAWLL